MGSQPPQVSKDALDDSVPDVDGTPWIRRVLRCTLLWGALAIAAFGFDVVMDRGGWSSDGMPDDLFPPKKSWPDVRELANAAEVIAVFTLLVGLIVGTILPSRLDPSRLRRQTTDMGDTLAPPNVIVHTIRRAAVATAFVSALTCAALTGLLSITTDITQDDSPSTLGALGGVALGTAAGLVVALVAGPVVGVVAGLAIDHELSRRRSIALVTLTAVAVSVIPIASLLGLVPEVAPRLVDVASVGTLVAGCFAAAVWLLADVRSSRSDPG